MLSRCRHSFLIAKSFPKWRFSSPAATAIPAVKRTPTPVQPQNEEEFNRFNTELSHALYSWPIALRKEFIARLSHCQSSLRRQKLGYDKIFKINGLTNQHLSLLPREFEQWYSYVNLKNIVKNIHDMENCTIMGRFHIGENKFEEYNDNNEEHKQMIRDIQKKYHDSAVMRQIVFRFSFFDFFFRLMIVGNFQKFLIYCSVCNFISIRCFW